MTSTSTRDHLTAYLDKFQAERGITARKRARRFLVPFVDFLRFRELDAAALDDFAAHLRQQGLAASSANRHIGTVKAFLDWLRRRKLTSLTRDDIADFKQFKLERPLPEVLTPDEIQALLNTAAQAQGGASQRLRIWLILGLTLGCRPSELCALSPANVNLLSREVRVWGTKTGIERRVPFHESPSAIRLLTRLCEVKPGPFIKTMHHKTWHGLCERAGVKPYARKVLRSTAAAYIASGSKGTEYITAARFGHSTGVAIRHYREPLYGVTGDTIEEWMGATEAFQACTDAACAYRYKLVGVVD